MDYHLVCVHPFGKYDRGQTITDPLEVEVLSEDREHNFVRIAVPDYAGDLRTALEREADEQAELARQPNDPAVTKALADGQALIGKMATDKEALNADPAAQPWPAPQPEKFASKKSTPT